MIKNWLKYLPLILLVVAIAFSPEFVLGKIGGERNVVIRIEDVLLVILGLVWTTNFLISGRSKIEKPPLFFPILVWLSIGFFSILTNWIFGNLEISRGFFYFLKEIEFFFLYFYVFYHIKNIDSAKVIVNFWMVLAVVATTWIIFQFVDPTKPSGTYGPSLLGEKGPLPSGGFFLILFASFLNIFLYYYSRLSISKIKKVILALCVLSLIIGVISSGSKTAVFGLVLVIILSFFFYQIRQGGLKPIFTGLIALIIVGGAISVINMFGRVYHVEGLESLIRGIGGLALRQTIWQDQLESFFSHSPFYIFFGLGKSVLLEGEESHSQYVRNFIETGIIGSLAFLFLIFVIIKKTWQGFSSGGIPLKVGLSAGLLVSTFAMLFISIAAEGFLVVRPNELYWFFAGLIMAVLSLHKKYEFSI